MSEEFSKAINEVIARLEKTKMLYKSIVKSDRVSFYVIVNSNGVPVDIETDFMGNVISYNTCGDTFCEKSRTFTHGAAISFRDMLNKLENASGGDGRQEYFSIVEIESFCDDRINLMSKAFSASAYIK